MTMKRDNIIGKTVKLRREKLGYTQSQLADILKITVQSIGYYERGERIPSDARLEEICTVLQLSHGEYVRLLSEKHPSHSETFGEPFSVGSTECERDAKNILDIAQKQGIIPSRLPAGVVRLIVGELVSINRERGKHTMDQVKRAYEKVRESNPSINYQCEICELMSNPAISEQDLREILAILHLKTERIDSKER